jgi:undecaprenyl-diphosphatase
LLVFGAAAAWLTAMAAMRWLVRYLQHHDFSVFGYYRIVIAMLFWLLVY